MQYNRTRNGSAVYLIQLLAAALLVLVFVVSILLFRPVRTTAATNSTLNFQARLQTAAGALVPDGYYNIQFKLYDGGTSGGPAGTGQANAGTNLWTESYYDTNGVTAGNDFRVRVVNGYFSVNLGSQTAFPGTINWDQELWLTMNIGGTTQTATPTYDGEMLNSANGRIKLTGVPYAFRSGALLDNAGNAFRADQLVQLASGTVQTASSANPLIYINQTGAGNILQLQGSTSDKLTLSNAGVLTVAGTGTFQGASVTVGTTSQAGSLVLNDGTSNTATLSMAAYGQNSVITLPDPGGASDTICLQTLANCGGSATTLQGAYNNDANGSDATISLTSTDGSLIFLNPSSSGSASNYVLTVDQQASGAVGGLDIQSAGTGNLLRVRDNTATARDVLTIADGGATTFRNQTDSTSGFQIQNAAGTNLFKVDTSGSKVFFGGNSVYDTANDKFAIGTATPDTAKLYVTTGSVAIKANQTSTNYLLELQKNGTDVVQIAHDGTTVFKNSTDNTASFQIQNAAGTSIFNVDTANQDVTTSSLNVGTVTGNRVFTDNFETGNLNLWQTQVGSVSADTTTVLSGKYAGKINVTAANAYAERQFNGGAATMYARGYVYIASASTKVSLFSFYNLTDTFTNSELTVYRQAGGNIAVWSAPLSGGTGGDCVTGGALSTGAWHKISLKVVLSNTGSCQVTVDDGTPSTSGSVDTLATNNPTRFSFGSHAGVETNVTYFDEFAVDFVALDNVGSATVQDTLHVGGTATFSGLALFQPSTTSTSSFQIRDTTGNVYFNADSTQQTLTLGGTGQVGTLTLGQSTDTNTISIGSNNSLASGKTQTINIGTSTGAGSTTNISIGSSIAGTTAITGPTTITNRTSGSSDTFNVSNSTSTGTIAQFKDNATNVFSLADGGAALFQNATNSTTGFQIQNAAGTQLFNVDSSNSYVINNGIASLGNEVQNPSFEAGAATNASGWDLAGGGTITTAAADAHTGNKYLQGTGNSSNHTIGAATKLMAVNPGDVIYYEGWVKNSAGANGTGGFYLSLYDKDMVQSGFSTGDSWTLPGTSYVLRTNSFTIPAGYYYVGLSTTVRNDSTTGTWYFDDLYMKKSNEIAPMKFQNSANSTTAFQIQNASGAAVLVADTTNSKITATSSTNGIATIGSTLFSGTSCSGTNWSGSGLGIYTHTTGSTAALTCTPPAAVTAGTTYILEFDIGGSVTFGESLTPMVGNNTGAPIYSNGASLQQVFVASNTNPLTFTPTSNFDGTLTLVSLKPINTINSVLSLNNSNGTTGLEIRSGGYGGGIYYNTVIGTNALQGNTSGVANTAIGYGTMQYNTAGNQNTAVGAWSLGSNVSGSNNTSLGWSALTYNLTGNDNTAVGINALGSNTTGSKNTAIGKSALFVNKIGSNNTAIGYSAGSTDPNKSAFATLGNLQNATAIGYGAQVQASNSLILGSVGTVASNLTPNVGIGTTSPTNLFSISPNIYDTGTASTSSSATVVGSGTTWTSSMVGMEFVFANGNKYTITGFTDATHLTLSASSTNASQAYRIHNPAFYVTSTGTAALRSSTNSSTAFQIQNAAGSGLFIADTTKQIITTLDQNVGSASNIGSTGRLFSDSFESNNLKLWTTGAQTSGTSTAAVGTAQVRNGKYAAQIVGSGSGTAYIQTSISGGTSIMARGYVYVTSMGANDMNIFQINAGANSFYISRQNSTNNLIATKCVSGCTAYSSSTAVTASAWHEVEANITINASTGSIVLYLDGTQVLNQTGINTGSSNASAFVIGDSGAGKTYNESIDDVVVDSVRPGDSASLNVADSLHVAGTSTFSSSMLIQPAVDSTIAFQVMNAAADQLLVVDTSLSKVSIGGGAVTTVLALDNASSDPTGYAGAMYYDSSLNRFRCYTTSWVNCDTTGAGGGNTRTVRLVPEFPGGVLSPDGSNNSGTIYSDFVAGLSALQGEKHNYYEWSTSQSTAQDYRVVVNVPIPSEYASIGAASTFKFWIYDGDGASTNAKVNWEIRDDDETSCFASDFNASASNTWEQVSASSLGTCTFSADQTMTVIFNLSTTASAGVIRVGEFEFKYSN